MSSTMMTILAIAIGLTVLTVVGHVVIMMVFRRLIRQSEAKKAELAAKPNDPQ
ncbi:hypothetical protein [Ponticaulis sp.]|uniref:hypothetical protein n=1 Tax=Ponticaulis sp. TaxID=2020902 RepID=UPI0025CD0BBE|nr:hypothetical protein [Ponticaulis sp.]|tara:strand:+ start:122 stop:280 length:159 start_codon:yes stop_codon:yes gene_type:complete